MATGTEIFAYTAIADGLRTVSLSNYRKQKSMVKPVNGIRTFPLTANVVQSNRYTLEFANNPNLYRQRIYS